MNLGKLVWIYTQVLWNLSSLFLLEEKINIPTACYLLLSLCPAKCWMLAFHCSWNYEQSFNDLHEALGGRAQLGGKSGGGFGNSVQRVMVWMGAAPADVLCIHWMNHRIAEWLEGTPEGHPRWTPFWKGEVFSYCSWLSDCAEMACVFLVSGRFSSVLCGHQL